MHILETAHARVSVLDYGATTQDVHLTGPFGDRHVVLGHADPATYVGGKGSMGVIAGRVANRIGGAGFTLDGVRHVLDANEGANTLHGGSQGLQRQVWQADPDGAHALRLSHRSPHGAMGFPGVVDFTVTIRLEETAQGAIRLIYEMDGVPDRPTPISLAQHNYWTLHGGTAPILDHRLQAAAPRFVAVDAALIPTGALPATAETRNDFGHAPAIGTRDPDRTGHDVCLCFDTHAGDHDVALTAPDGCALHLSTDQPGLQVYTGAHLAPQGQPLPGQKHLPFHGICLEPQGYPDAVNNPHFPGVIHTPQRPYRQCLVATITP